MFNDMVMMYFLSVGGRYQGHRARLKQTINPGEGKVMVCHPIFNMGFCEVLC